jgi:CRP-like cAMP-binding protein
MTTEELANALQGANLDLKSEHLAALKQAASERELYKGDKLLTEGEPSNALYIVVTGWLSVTSAGSELGRCGPGRVVGEISLLDGGPATASVTADSKCSLLCVDRPAFDALHQRDPRAATAFLQLICSTLAERLRASSDRLEQLSGGGQPAVQRSSLLGVLRSLFFGGKEDT